MTIPTYTRLYRPGLDYQELHDLHDAAARSCNFMLDGELFAGETSYGTIARVDRIIESVKGETDPAAQGLHERLFDLWLILNDMHGMEATMFGRLLDVIGAVLHGGQVEAVPHAHISTRSRDCDGPHEYYSIQRLRLPGDPDLSFSIRDLARQMIPITTMSLYVRDLDHQQHGPEDVGGNLMEISWSHAHDEGGTSTEIVGCLDSCDLDESSQRDVYAEQMGY